MAREEASIVVNSLIGVGERGADDLVILAKPFCQLCFKAENVISDYLFRILLKRTVRYNGQYQGIRILY